MRIAEDSRATPSVGELARLNHYSPSRFAHIFAGVTGEPPRRFMVRMRLHHAERLLRDSGMSIGEIAEAAGFRDIYFFSRQFKRYNGLCPTEYRAAARKPG
ncbi:MAG: AraC family transcriptional regulator [Kiritimatiellae bacterium]|nr:AraC family transcriptional regulator [Kiritimatiellia bacterium]